MNLPGPATPQHRSSTETPGAIPARTASSRISAARMKLSCSTNSSGACADMPARCRAWASTMYERTGKARYRQSVLMSMRPAVQAGPVTGLISQVLLLAALAATVAMRGDGLGRAGWIVGISCGLIMDGALARGISHHRAERLGPADRVTLARATIAIGVAALTADSLRQPVPVALLVALAAVALVLDAVDGWVARRTRTAAALGARFDGEVDAFLILVLSVYVSRSVG